MSKRFIKILSLLLLMWLPLFSGSALAASVSMQMPAGHCQDESMLMANMSGMDMHSMSDTSNEHNPTCNVCGVCHLACSGYLAVPSVTTVAVLAAARDAIPYLVSFRSITSTPLLPPPLTRA